MTLSLSDIEDFIGSSRVGTPTNAIESADLGLSDQAIRLLQESDSTTPSIPSPETRPIISPAISQTVSPATPQSQGDLPLNLTFWDGSEALNVFPDHLKAQIKQACRQQDTVVPDCVKSTWPWPQNVFRSAAGWPSQWFDPDTAQELLVARFHYGTRHQILIAKQQVGTSINNGAAFIIVHARFSNHSYKKNRGVVAHEWEVWEPNGCSSGSQYIIREFRTRDPSESSDADTVDSVVDLANTDDMQEVVGHGKTATGSPPRQHTRSSDRMQTEGSLIVKRESDKALVLVQCPKCDNGNHTSEAGLYDHLRSVHSIVLQGYNQVAEIYGVPLSDSPRRSTRTKVHPKTLDFSAPASTTAGGKKRRRQRVTAPRSGRTDGNTDSRKNSTILTSNLPRHYSHQSAPSPPESRPPAPHPLQAPLGQRVLPSIIDTDKARCQFTLHPPNPQSSPPRIRSFAACNTIQKLFVHALAAGAATKYDLALTCTVSTAPPMYVVRGDEEDFARLVAAIDQAIQQTGSGAGDVVNVLISAERLE